MNPILAAQLRNKARQMGEMQYSAVSSAVRLIVQGIMSEKEVGNAPPEWASRGRWRAMLRLAILDLDRN